MVLPKDRSWNVSSLLNCKWRFCSWFILLSSSFLSCWSSLSWSFLSNLKRANAQMRRLCYFYLLKTLRSNQKQPLWIQYPHLDDEIKEHASIIEFSSINFSCESSLQIWLWSIESFCCVVRRDFESVVIFSVASLSRILCCHRRVFLSWPSSVFSTEFVEYLRKKG